MMATFSPFATSRVMVSSTDSSACAAALRLPSIASREGVDQLTLVHKLPFRERRPSALLD